MRPWITVKLDYRSKNKAIIINKIHDFIKDSILFILSVIIAFLLIFFSILLALLIFGCHEDIGRFIINTWGIFGGLYEFIF